MEVTQGSYVGIVGMLGLVNLPLATLHVNEGNLQDAEILITSSFEKRYFANQHEIAKPIRHFLIISEPC